MRSPPPTVSIGVAESDGSPVEEVVRRADAALHTTKKVLVVWSAFVLCGFAFLIRYSATAGTGDQGNSTWPRDSRIVRMAGRPTLLVFLHPACPCSRATVEELSRLLTQVGTAVDTTAVFIRPGGLQIGWEQSDIWKNAESLPGVRVVVDPGGEEARRFGAATSGCTLLYEPGGRLVFCGGITAARGHEGDNAGKTAILSWFENGRAEPSETPVFGCPLFDK